MVVTPVRHLRLAQHLHGYDPDEFSFLVDGFKFGFRIPFQGVRQPRVCTNHYSARENPSQVSKKIFKEVQKGRILGPFLVPPFRNFFSSPLSLVPKKEPGAFRLIHDLSFPKGAGTSINEGISREDAVVVYDSIDTVVKLVKKFGMHALMAKTDIKDAFRLLPIHPSDRELLGFTWKNEEGQTLFFCDACLPMGLSTSCQIFERFSCALQWVMETRYNAAMSHMIDDFFFIGPADSVACSNALNNFLRVAQDIGIPIKEEKTVLPTTRIIIYGIEIDSKNMTARLPEDKVKKIQDMLEVFRRRKKVTLQELQSLVGLLNFATAVVQPGRTFLRRLYDLMLGVKNPNHLIRLTVSARADLAAWHLFMSNFNGKSVFLFDHVVSSDAIRLFTDAAASVGYAAVLGSHWFADSWKVDFQRHHINTLELFPIVLAMELWGQRLANHRVVFLSDNFTTVQVINHKSSRCPDMMRLVRRLVVVALAHNIAFSSEHIPGKTNMVADLLSRNKLQEARAWAPWLDKSPQEIPERWLNI